MLCAAPADEVVCPGCAASLPRAEPSCRQCALPIPEPGLCGDCLASPPGFDAAVSVFAYAFPVDRLVRQFKFSADLAVGRWLGRQLAARVIAEPRPDVLVVPPAPPARLRERGFNQALEMAKEVSARLDVPLLRDALVRIAPTSSQVALGRSERRRNLRSAFGCARPFEGLDVAVVDDVMTTGATADALAGVLKAAGAARVRVWVAARTPDPRLKD
jgi:ComF family protein